MKRIKFLLILSIASIHYSTLIAQDFSKVPGSIVAYSPASSGIFLGSPSIAILPNGNYVASHDHFGPNSGEWEEATTNIYKSPNKGESWIQIAQIKGQFWSNLFVHDGDLYIMGTDRHHGNVIIRRSTNGGVTWTTPEDRDSGLLLVGEYHTAPMPVLKHNGRLWRAMESADGPVKQWGKRYGSFVMSAPNSSDLLKAENWLSSIIVWYDSTYMEGNFGGWLEGNVLVTPQNNMINLIRTENKVDPKERAAVIEISDDGREVSFNPENGFIDFPGATKKFTIRYDENSKLYWTLSNYISCEFKGKLNTGALRNTQALSYSEDLKHWKVAHIFLFHPDLSKHAFQYLDWHFEGKDIIAVSRTAYDDGLGGARKRHDANFITFHRLKDFRKHARKNNFMSGNCYD